ncbi:MAG: hypothetical protein WC374_05645 [Phycisphaerae bacterium]|jgi:hypothetical protein
MTDTEFFEILGYLSSPARNTKLDVETHPRRRASFETEFEQLTGIRPEVDNHNYYVWDEEANKWGTELRIYFNNSENASAALRNMIVSPRPNFGYNARINNNSFVWRLIEYGFLLRDGQDSNRVRQLVPTEYTNVFERGYNLT